jgi:hypothetical protein
MADKLKKDKQKMSVTVQEELSKGVNPNDIEELGKMLFRIKVMEEQAAALLSKFEKK